MTTLGAWLKDQGFTVDDNNVPYGRESTWRGVDFLMVHHTVSDCDGSESGIADYCKYGSSGTYPPLCQIVLGHSGKVWVTCKERSGQPDPGRASHAGSGDGYGVPDDTMNERALGIEVQCIGDHKLATHDTQYKTLIRLLAALRRRYHVPYDNVIGHKEWSTTGKVDPRDDMATIRAEVDAAMEGEVGYDYDYSGKPSGVLHVGRDYVYLDIDEWDPPSKGLEHVMTYLNCSAFTFDGDRPGRIRVCFERNTETSDRFGYQDYVVVPGIPELLITHATYEQGDGTRTWTQIRCLDGLQSMDVGTRYAKRAVVK